MDITERTSSDLARTDFVEGYTLRIPDGYAITWEEMEHTASALSYIHNGSNFWIGDILNIAEQRFGESWAQLAESLQVTPSKASQLKWVSARVPPENRFTELYWTHHRHVAAFDVKEQKFWLMKAIDDGLSPSQLKTKIDKDEKYELPDALVTPVYRSTLVVEEPQWGTLVASTRQGAGLTRFRFLDNDKERVLIVDAENKIVEILD